MNQLDIILLIILAFGGYNGYKKGLFIEIVGIISFVLGIVGGFKLLHFGIDFLTDHFGYFSHLIPYIAFLLIFVIIIILANILGKMVKKILDLTILGSMDNFAGALIGIFKWAIGISILIWLTQTVGFDFPSSWHEGSFLYGYIHPLGPKTIELITSLLPFFGDLVESVKEMIEPQSN